MDVAVAQHAHWKTEHGPDGSEDAADFDIARGVFVVADGVSTTSFSREWARFLVEQFLARPLLSADPFELEWWMGETIAAYPGPDLAALPPGVLQEKAAEGGASTLIALRTLDVTDTAARAELLAVGDSCALIAAADAPARVAAFPVADGPAFDERPICLYSRSFDRFEQPCATREVTLRPGDVVVLATDAVARWIVEGGRARQPSPADALRRIARLPAGGWGAFIEGCRARREMVDDDSTALVIHCLGPGETGETGGDWQRGRLGATVALPAPIAQARQRELERALNASDSVATARLLGDPARSGLRAAPVDVAQVRQAADGVAKGMAEVLDALNAPAFSPAAVQAAWTRHALLLDREPAAAKLRRTLINEGLIVAAAGRGGG